VGGEFGAKRSGGEKSHEGAPWGERCLGAWLGELAEEAKQHVSATGGFHAETEKVPKGPFDSFDTSLRPTLSKLSLF